MRISDWSSDVCSSDLVVVFVGDLDGGAEEDAGLVGRTRGIDDLHRFHSLRQPAQPPVDLAQPLADVDVIAILRTVAVARRPRSEEHKSELQSLKRISYDVFCLKKNKTQWKSHEQHKPKTE